MKNECELCGSKDDYLNFHHLIPRTLHSTRFFEKTYEKRYMKEHGIWICKMFCHRQIHRLITEKEMGLSYNTLEKLLNNEKVSSFINWRKKRL